MARIRTVKPEFWTDGVIVDLSVWARLFYIGTWNFALCDQGHLDDDPKSLKLKILPADAVNAVEIVDELIDAGRIVRKTTAEGRTYLHIPRLSDHQKTDARWNTRCPYCNTAGSAKPAAPRQDTSSLAETPASSGESAETPPSKGKERRGEEGNGEERKEDTRGARVETPPSTRPAFARFDEVWAVYPLQDGETAARKAWVEAIKRDSPDAIIAGAIRYRDSPQRNAQFTKRLANWLKDDCWRDRMAPAAPPPRSARAAPDLEEHNGLMLGRSNVLNLERHERMKALQAQRDAEAATNQPPAIEGRTR